MNLEDLVPPLELCKKIPEGEFAESAMVWLHVEGEWDVYSRYEDVDGSECGEIPAPTLQEILAELDAEGLCCPSARFDSDQWTVYWIDNHVNEIWCAHESDKNPAIAALKLWLAENKTYKSNKTYEIEKEK